MKRIRSYMKPIEIPLNQKINLSDIIPENPQCEEIFVICEDPLLEMTQKDLAFLRALQIDIFSAD